MRHGFLCYLSVHLDLRLGGIFRKRSAIVAKKAILTALFFSGDSSAHGASQDISSFKSHLD